MFKRPSEDTVAASQRAIRTFECGEKAREKKRHELARNGLLMVAPGRW